MYRRIGPRVGLARPFEFHEIQYDLMKTRGTRPGGCNHRGGMVPSLHG